MRGPQAIPDSEYRWQSIQQVAGEIGLRIDPALVIRIDSAGWSMKTGQHPMAPEIGYKPMQGLLEKRATSLRSSASTTSPPLAPFAP